MLWLHSNLVLLHIFVGAISLPLFWVPMLARKGSSLHRRAGRWFANAMYVVSITGLITSVMVLIDPLAIRDPEGLIAAEDIEQRLAIYRSSSLFLLMLSVLVFTSVRQGMLALKYKHDRDAFRRWSNVAQPLVLLTLAIVTGYVGIRDTRVLLMIFAALSVSASIGMLRYAFAREVTPRAWLIEHLNGMIGGGIGAYTAFFAFGGRRFFSELLPGYWQILPWVLPAVIGTIAISVYSRRYRRQIPARNAAVD